MIAVRTQAALDKALAADPNAEITLVKGSFKLMLAGAAAPVLIVMGAAHLDLIAWETSSPRVVARETSSPSVEARETSSPHVVAKDTSSPRVVARETSSPSVEAWGTSSPHVVAWETSSPSVEAWGTSSPHVVAWGTSSPRVVAWGTSSPHVVAWETSSPSVVARGFSSVYAKGKITVSAGERVTVRFIGPVKIDGGIQIDVSWKTAREWCDVYGVRVENDIAYVYKGVDDNFRSLHGGDYTPGTTPSVRKFHGGSIECGAGALYFSPSPAMTREFFPEATKFLLCPVALADIAVHPDGEYPQKIGARGCCGPVLECNEDGELVEVQS